MPHGGNDIFQCSAEGADEDEGEDEDEAVPWVPKSNPTFIWSDALKLQVVELEISKKILYNVRCLATHDKFILICSIDI